MAEGNGAIYNNFKERILAGDFNLANAGDTLMMMLVSGHTPDIDTHVNYTSVSGNEYGAGSGYTVGGELLTGQAISQNNTSDRGEFNADDVTWTSLGPLTPATPSHAILYSITASNQLIAYWELGTTATNGGDYTLQFGATIINVT